MDKSLKAIYDWSMRQQGDGTSEQRPEINQEDIEWLRQAFSGPSEVEIMIACRGILMDPNATVEQLESALDTLLSLVESIDNAELLDRIGVLAPLLSLLKHPAASVRSGSAWVLASSLQDNTKLRPIFQKQNGFAQLQHLLERDENFTVREKCLVAISAYVGNNQEGLNEFLSHKGLETIMTVVTDFSAGELPMLRKAVFLITKLLLHGDDVRTRLLQLDFPTALVRLLGAQDESLMEKTLICALVFAGSKLEERGASVVCEESQCKEVQQRLAQVGIPEVLNTIPEYGDEYDVPRLLTELSECLRQE